MSFDQLDFTTFCIGNIASKLVLPENEVYRRLKMSGILDYVIKGYDVLHTFSREYLVNDLVSLMKEKGALS